MLDADRRKNEFLAILGHELRNPLARQAHQHLEVRRPDAPVVVMADPVRLSQVCANLLHNAVKYTPDGGHIVVSLQQDGADAVIRVRDDGIGIPGRDGYRLAADIRAAALEPRPFLVALTGYGQESDREKVRRGGFDRHLLKPADPKEIEALLVGLAPRSGALAAKTAT